MDAFSRPEGFGEVEFPPVLMLPEVVLDCRDPSQWVVLDGQPVADLPPVRPRPDTTGWPVVSEPPPETWLGSFDEQGNRFDESDDTRRPAGG